LGLFPSVRNSHLIVGGLELMRPSPVFRLENFSHADSTLSNQELGLQVDVWQSISGDFNNWFDTSDNCRIWLISGKGLQLFIALSDIEDRFIIGIH